MNFDIGDEGTEIVGTIADFFERRDDGRLIAESSSSRRAASRIRWEALCELGLPALRVPEPAGIGASLLTAVAVAERMGAVLLPEPAVSAIVMGPLMRQSPAHTALADEICAGELIAALCESRTPGVNASVELGGSSYAPDDLITSLIAVPLGSSLAVVEIGDLPVVSRLETDATRTWVEYNLDAASPVAVFPLPENVLGGALLEYAVLTVAELVGGMQKVLDHTIRYVIDREQFGRSIGSFQAIKHQLADMYVATEQARASVQFAALAITADESDAGAVAAAATRWVPSVAVTLFEKAIHIHGAMGYSWELDIHLHLRRALVTRQLLAGMGSSRETVSAP